MSVDGDTVSASTGEIREELVALGRRTTQFMHQLVKLCAQFEDSTEWALDHEPTPAHWIASRLDVEVSTAREWIRIGKALRDLPEIEAAFGACRISYSKVRALTRVATPQHESELCNIAQGVPAGQLHRVLAGWLLAKDGEEATKERHQRERGLFLSTEPDGSFRGTIRLPALEGAQLTAAIGASVMANPPSADASCPSLAQQRVDALVRLITGAEGAQIDTEIVIHVRGNGSEFDDGTPVAGSIVECLAPSSFLRALIHDAESNPIDASNRRRHPTMRQRRVVKERDRVCVDCGSTEFLQYDHDPEYEVTGHTQVDELVLRCSRCHRLRHEKARQALVSDATSEGDFPQLEASADVPSEDLVT